MQIERERGQRGAAAEGSKGKWQDPPDPDWASLPRLPVQSRHSHGDTNSSRVGRHGDSRIEGKAVATGIVSLEWKK